MKEMAKFKNEKEAIEYASARAYEARCFPAAIGFWLRDEEGRLCWLKK